SPAPVDLDLHARVRHRVPVDGQPGPADVGRAGESDAAPAPHPTALALVPALLQYALQALAQPDGAHLHLVRGDGAGRHRVVEAPARRIEAEVGAELVDVALEGKAGLGRAVPALGT